MFSALLLTLLMAPPTVDVTDDAIVPPHGTPVMPWLDVDEESHPTPEGPPLALLSTPLGDPAAKIWVTVNPHALHVHIEVHDAAHFNKQRGTQIWDGDSVQIGVDARGHGSAGLARDADFVGTGDVYAAFALTDAGVQGWAHLRGAPDSPGAVATPSRIVHDTSKALTTYDIALPWPMLHTIPNAFDTLGLSVQINDADPGRATQEHLHWGGGPPGTLRPGLLQTLAYDMPPEGYVDAMQAQSDLWRPDDAPEIIVVRHTSTATPVHSTWSGHEEVLTLASAPGATRTRLHARGAAWSETVQPWHVAVPTSTGPSAEIEVAVHAPPLEFARASEQLTALVNEASDPHVLRHVRGIHSILQQAWYAALTLLPNNPEPARDTLQAAQHLLPTLTQTCHNTDGFFKGEHDLLDTFVSGDDDTLQPFSVRLPRSWDAAKAAPVIVFLHGKGDPQVTHFVDQTVMGKDAPENDAIILRPWGRGIYGYRHMAERDVLNALATLRSNFNIDANRVYLAGFSMGGAGAWNLALHHPSPWAAVSISSGGTWLTSLGVGLGINAKDVPLQIWHGDADGAVDVTEAYAMRDELKKNGVKADITIAHGAGHVFDESHWRRMVEWLLPHRRAPTTGFTYVVDDFEHRGRDGVKLYRDTRTQPFPRMRVKIDGNRVTLDTQGTPGLTVDLGRGGLELTGDVTVRWNGKKAYAGPAQSITLGSGGGAR